jgi:hypothetical protein
MTHGILSFRAAPFVIPSITNVIALETKWVMDGVKGNYEKGSVFHKRPLDMDPLLSEPGLGVCISILFPFAIRLA